MELVLVLLAFVLMCSFVYAKDATNYPEKVDATSKYSKALATDTFRLRKRARSSKKDKPDITNAPKKKSMKEFWVVTAFFAIVLWILFGE